MDVEEYRAHLRKRAQGHMVPEHTAEDLIRYTVDRIPVGGFLEAVLSNDLMESMGRADEFNRMMLFPICSFIYSDLPRTAWGSPETYREWIA